MLPNGVEAAIAIYGVLRAGAAFSPLNPTIKRDKLAHVLADSGAAAVVCDDERAEVVRGDRGLAAGSRFVTDVEADGAGRRRAAAAR